MSTSLLESLREAVRRRPRDTGARLQLANLLLESGHPDEALEHFEALVATSPENPDALDGAAVAAARCGDAERAAQHREALERLGPRTGVDRPRLRVVRGGGDGKA